MEMCKAVCTPVRLQSQAWTLPQDDWAKGRWLSPEPRVGRHSGGAPALCCQETGWGSQAPEQLGFISF